MNLTIAWGTLHVIKLCDPQDSMQKMSTLSVVWKAFDILWDIKGRVCLQCLHSHALIADPSLLLAIEVKTTHLRLSQSVVGVMRPDWGMSAEMTGL